MSVASVTVDASARRRYVWCKTSTEDCASVRLGQPDKCSGQQREKFIRSASVRINLHSILWESPFHSVMFSFQALRLMCSVLIPACVELWFTENHALRVLSLS